MIRAIDRSASARVRPPSEKCFHIRQKSTNILSLSCRIIAQYDITAAAAAAMTTTQTVTATFANQRQPSTYTCIPSAGKAGNDLARQLFSAALCLQQLWNQPLCQVQSIVRARLAFHHGRRKKPPDSRHCHKILVHR